MSRGKIRRGGLSGGQVECLIGAERHACGVGPVELLLAEVGAHLVQAVPAVACFKLLPRLPGPAEEGLRNAVEHGRPVPVTRIGGQARQAETGEGDTGTIPVAAAHPQGGLEAGSRAAGVAVLVQHPAHVDRQVDAFFPAGPHSLCRLLQVGSGGGDVAGAQGMNAGVVGQVIGNEVVAGSLGAGDGLGEQWPGVSGVDDGFAQQIPR